MARMIRKAATRPAVLSLSGLLIALSVEFVDELVDGTKGAALPLIRLAIAPAVVLIMMPRKSPRIPG